jgi:hypothetical protein
MGEAKPYLWYYGGGSEPESYQGGYATREKAIAEGRSEYGSDVFSVCEAQKGAFALMDADDFLQLQFERWADDDIGAEDSPDWQGKPEAVRAATQELDALLTAWSDKHADILPSPWCFENTRNHETFNLDREDEQA